MDVFEGSEKKCEVIMDGTQINLRQFSKDFWHQMVDRCEATVLSEIHNESCDAYLLSESSLFVWEDHFLLITCGQTKLIQSLLFFVEHVDISCIQQILFQRKNEYYSEMQHSDFTQDVEQLNRLVQGKSLSFGTPDKHYTDLFHLEENYEPAVDDRTYELLMYGIAQDSTHFFMTPNLTVQAIRSYLRVSDFLAGWQLDDFAFEPCGYSLNAIHGDRYLTIHVTPQQEYSYVSLESNVDLQEMIAVPLQILRPNSFDLVMYQPSDVVAILEQCQQYKVVQQEEKNIDCGYQVIFMQLELQQALN